MKMILDYVCTVKIIFISAFIAKYVLGYPLKSCILSGIEAGNYIIKQPGITKRGQFNV